MHRTKASRIRVLVPSALAVVILTGAAAPAGAAEGTGGAASRVEAAQEQINERVAAAGPIEDIFASVSKILADLTRNLGTLLPGVAIPEIKLPVLPSLPSLPSIPEIPELPLPGIPDVPAIPELPVGIPGLPVSVPAAPPAAAVPAVPGVPAVPALPLVPPAGTVPTIPDFLP
ncbi:hypothetical protein ACFWCB_31485 [Streptomyces sp. NPDC060048]|uniref:hypothetical protein n=1 Tax=unclassified Streptomyces TaxID=2593676 RepID=UPI003689C087